MRIWVDMDNAPHVLTLAPLVRELERRGCKVEITARDYGQTLPLLEAYGLPHRCVGTHAGKNKIKKVAGLLARSIALWSFARRQRFDAVLSHGARGCLLPARLFGLPLIVLMDYEHVFSLPFRRWARLILMPEAIPDDKLVRLGFDLSRVAKYPGLKEELYVNDFEPDSKSLRQAGIDLDRIVVVMRPPATMAHYHNPKSETLFFAALDYLGAHPGVQIVLLPRTSTQGAEILRRSHGKNGNLIVPKTVLQGPNLIWHADLVVGGGGTMNREAACLGLPVYSLFCGPSGAVDRYLIDSGKMQRLTSETQLGQIALGKRVPKPLRDHLQRSKMLLNYISDKIWSVLQTRT